MSEQNVSTEPVRALTFGEQLVGITFNPSNDDKVFKLKSLFAEVANLIQDEHLQHQEGYLRQMLFTHTVGEVLNAQMNCVKLVTLKY